MNCNCEISLPFPFPMMLETYIVSKAGGNIASRILFSLEIFVNTLSFFRVRYLYDMSMS